jgi:flagellar hook-length control protein FliK
MLVIAERGETAELLRRNIEQLANELKDMGYENLSFEFQSPSNSDREDAPKHESSHKSDDGSHQVELTEKQETHIISASLASDDRVDIRL